MYAEHQNEQDVKNGSDPKYTITIERRAQEYLDGIKSIFEDNE